MIILQLRCLLLIPNLTFPQSAEIAVVGKISGDYNLMPMKINDLKQTNLCVSKTFLSGLVQGKRYSRRGLIIILFTNKKGDGLAIAFFYIF